MLFNTNNKQKKSPEAAYSHFGGQPKLFVYEKYFLSEESHVTQENQHTIAQNQADNTYC